MQPLPAGAERFFEGVWFGPAMKPSTDMLMLSVSLGMIGMMAIESLDVLYLPSRDAEADLAFYRDVLGARVVFAIEAMGTRVAEVSLSPEGPRLLLADHLGGEAPILLHRVSSLDETLEELRRSRR